MATTIIQVSSTTELIAALRAVDGPAVIELAAGQYDDVRITRQSVGDPAFGDTVTLRSADPDNPAVITTMQVHSATNLSFENLFFDYTFTPGDTWRTSPFTVMQSENIAFRGNLFDGDIGFGDQDPATDGYPTAHGLYIRLTNHVIIEDNEFTGFSRGFKALSVQDMAITNNDFHGQRMDHAVFAEVHDVVIAHNLMRDHVASPDSVDHRDMIQFWNDNTAVSSSNVTIHGNTMILGENDIYTQAVFLGNGKVTRSGEGPEWYYKNFTITDNVIVNGHKHGIMMGHVDGALIANNTVIRDDVVSGTDPLYTPTIVVESDSTNVVVRDNVTPRVIGHADQPDWLVTGNVLIQDEDPLAPGYYGDLFINPDVGARSVIDNIRINPNGPLAGPDGGVIAGSSILAFDPTPDVLTARVQTKRDADAWTDFTFDGRLSAGPDGLVDAGARITWDFGDGTTAEGATVQHGYTVPGRHTVTMTVDAADGTRATTVTHVTVTDPEVLRLDTAAGGFVLEDTGAQIALVLEDVTAGGVTRKALVFDAGDDQVLVSRADLPSLAGAQDLTIALTLSSADWGALHVDRSSGEVLRLGSTFLRIEEDGTPLLRFATEDATPVVLRGDRALDTDRWQDLEIRFDGPEGLLTLELDGVAIAETTLSGRLPDSLHTDLSLGRVWSNTSFSGAIADLRITADMAAHARLAEPGPSPAPAPFTGYSLDTGLLEGTARLSGGASVGQDGAVTLDGIDGAITLDRIDMLAPSPFVALDMDWRRDTDDGGPVRLAWFHQRLGVQIEGDGLSLHLRSADGMERIRIDDLGLTDTDWHSLRLEVDSTTDTLRLHVDGMEVYRIDGDDGIDIHLDDPALATVWNWRFGGAWGSHLDGEIANLRISTEAPASAALVAPVAPVTPAPALEPDAAPEPAQEPAPEPGQKIAGGRGDDMLTGGSGDDTILLRYGSDTATGGAGADAFIFDWRYVNDGDAHRITDLDFTEGDTLTIRFFEGRSHVLADAADLDAFILEDGVSLAGTDLMLTGADGTTIYVALA